LMPLGISMPDICGANHNLCRKSRFHCHSKQKMDL